MKEPKATSQQAIEYRIVCLLPAWMAVADISWEESGRRKFEVLESLHISSL